MPLDKYASGLTWGTTHTSHGQMTLKMKIKWHKFGKIGVLEINHSCINSTFLLF